MSASVAYQLPGFGLKGQAAANWLLEQGIDLPQQPNTWLTMPDQSLVLRLGRSEFLLQGPVATRLESIWQGGRELYRVPRYDATFELKGEKVPALLQEICTLDTRPEAMAGQVLMMLAAGISVMLICETGNAGPIYRLWCDGTYGDYLGDCLQQILD